MHTLIVVAHPDRRSYTHRVLARFVAGLESNPNNTYEIADLAAENFDPRFTAADYDGACGKAPTSPSIIAEQKRIERADYLVLIFPVYWWSMPAQLKGWIDRVFTSGWAFVVDYEKVEIKKMLGKLKGQFIGIGGITKGTYERRGYLDAINKEIGEGIFDFCGMEIAGSELLLPRYQAYEGEGLQRAFDIGSNLCQHEK